MLSLLCCSKALYTTIPTLNTVHSKNVNIIIIPSTCIPTRRPWQQRSARYTHLSYSNSKVKDEKRLESSFTSLQDFTTLQCPLVLVQFYISKITPSNQMLNVTIIHMLMLCHLISFSLNIDMATYQDILNTGVALSKCKETCECPQDKETLVARYTSKHLAEYCSALHNPTCSQ